MLIAEIGQKKSEKISDSSDALTWHTEQVFAFLKCTHMLHKRKKDRYEGLDGQKQPADSWDWSEKAENIQMVVMHSHDTQNKFLHFWNVLTCCTSEKKIESKVLMDKNTLLIAEIGQKKSETISDGSDALTWHTEQGFAFLKCTHMLHEQEEDQK